MSTPHNSATKGDIAKTVLMPGDPLRAKHIAETYLSDPVLFNSVRGMLGFTGTYEGKRISVMASGMGMPSIGIYSYELYSQYDVDNIIRIGSAGAYTEKCKVGDVLLADSAFSESTYAKMQSGYDKDTIRPSEKLNGAIKNAAKELGIALTTGTIHSSDVFYYEGKGAFGIPEEEYEPRWKVLEREKGILAVEMESFALFNNAKVLGKNAACMVTISDSLVTHEGLSAEDRQTTFHNMFKVALRAGVSIDN
ncbi:MAG: purine-nucleoside phosphorylase [Bifidobacteriaceae bacterium]|jgi:purine-nucleoside phosphorylase|nr:purine-nucleoside phosphorylase [Bifidobacteriaceae bacterium]